MYFTTITPRFQAENWICSWFLVLLFSFHRSFYSSFAFDWLILTLFLSFSFTSTCGGSLMSVRGFYICSGWLETPFRIDWSTNIDSWQEIHSISRSRYDITHIYHLSFSNPMCLLHFFPSSPYVLLVFAFSPFIFSTLSLSVTRGTNSGEMIILFVLLFDWFFSPPYVFHWIFDSLN